MIATGQDFFIDTEQEVYLFTLDRTFIDTDWTGGLLIATREDLLLTLDRRSFYSHWTGPFINTGQEVFGLTLDRTFY